MRALVVGRVFFNGTPLGATYVGWKKAGHLGGSTITDEFGEYQLGNVPAGRVRFEVCSLHGPSDPRLESTVEVPAAQHFEHDLHWNAPGAPIAGRVTVSTGASAARLDVHASSETARRDHFMTQCRADGSYRVEVPLDAPSWTVSVVSEGYGAEFRTGVLAGANDVDLVITPIRPVWVRFEDALTGLLVTPVTNDRWAVQWRLHGTTEYRNFRKTPKPTDTGIYELPVAADVVDLSIRCYAAQWQPAEVSGLRVEATSPNDPFTISVTSGIRARFERVEGSSADWNTHVQTSIFLLTETETEAFRGPVAETEPANWIAGSGLRLWIDRLDLLDRHVAFDAGGMGMVFAPVPAGSYSLVVFPPVFELLPATIELGPATEFPIRVERNWR